MDKLRSSKEYIDLEIYNEHYFSWDSLYCKGVTQEQYNMLANIKLTQGLGGNIDFARQHYSKKIELLITSDNTNDETIGKLMSILEPHKNGKCPLIIKCISKQHIVPLSLDEQWHINPTSVLINNLTKLLGSENIIVKYQ